MSSLQEIQGHIGSMKELRDVVGAMRALAAMRLQEAESALAGVRQYAQVMADALGAAWQLQGAHAEADAIGLRGRAARGQRIVILCTSEHGFVGSYNERLLDAAINLLQEGDELYVLGSRGVALATERARPIAWSQSMATRLAGIPDIVNRLSHTLLASIATGRIARVEACYQSSRSGSAIQHRQLLPLDTAALVPSSTPAPLHNLPPQALLEGLAAEYLYARLTEALVECLAGENAARFASMDSARQNVSRKLDTLRASAHQLRQDEINAELLDLITGEAALGPRQGHRGELPSALLIGR
jgi:F-type H+-transporting ATPase subunit gamma